MEITNVKQLIARLGGTLEVAYNMNVHQMTIHRWAKKNQVPVKYGEKLKALARSKRLANKHYLDLIAY